MDKNSFTLQAWRRSFGEKDLFIEWLNENNYYFDNKPPIYFIDTVAGIKFIDNQLTGMQYGDNA
ncbi:MAG: DUF2384 domain-containing protein [Bacteroidetes bacterium]|nr:DUF2384 domain-containing protein [Bacteroidota bacterium]